MAHRSAVVCVVMRCAQIALLRCRVFLRTASLRRMGRGRTRQWMGIAAAHTGTAMLCHLVRLSGRQGMIEHRQCRFCLVRLLRPLLWFSARLIRMLSSPSYLCTCQTICLVSPGLVTLSSCYFQSGRNCHDMLDQHCASKIEEHASS